MSSHRCAQWGRRSNGVTIDHRGVEITTSTTIAVVSLLVSFGALLVAFRAMAVGAPTKVVPTVNWRADHRQRVEEVWVRFTNTGPAMARKVTIKITRRSVTPTIANLVPKGYGLRQVPIDRDSDTLGLEGLRVTWRDTRWRTQSAAVPLTDLKSHLAANAR